MKKRKYYYKKYSHDWYMENREKISNKFKENYKTKEFRQKKLNERMRYMYKWKKIAFDILGKKCCKCGFKDERALQFDHVNSDGHIDNRKRNVTHYKKIALSIQNNEGRFQVLCCNCNWIKRVENKEYFTGQLKRKENIIDSQTNKICELF